MSSKQYFEEVAANWDAMRSDFFEEAVREQAIAKAVLNSGMIVADIGAGTGFVTAGLIQQGVNVIAVDQSPAMLEQMKANFPGVPVIDYRVGEAESLPIDDESVDAVFANMYLHHVENPAAAIKEMTRILKHGGRLIITDVDKHNHEFLLVEHHDRWPGFERDDIKKWYNQAGLTQISVDCTDQNCCAESSSSTDKADVSIFLAYGVKASTDNPVHKSVREHYGAIARGQSSSCCGDNTGGLISLDSIGTEAQPAASCCEPADHAELLYGVKSLVDLPVDVTGLSLGCGDPVTIAGLKEGETVLDLGSGGGIDCFLSARQVGATGHVIGVDMTPDMLAKANANKARLGADNVEFRQGQIEALPVDDNSVDVIMSNCVINLSPDKAAVFKESFRVLKSGGRISISDIVTEGHFSETMRADAAQWASCVSGAIDVTDYTRLMHEAGFTDITVVDKVEPDDLIEVVAKDPATAIPRIYSARITARKP